MDVDIDFRTDFDPLDYFEQAIRASRVFKDDLSSHPAGAYLQNIPADKLTGLSAIPFKEAEELGYFKIDFLHLTVLDHFTSKEQIRVLANAEPDWDLLLSAANVEKLFQIHRYADLIFKVKPRSVQELAIVLHFSDQQSVIYFKHISRIVMLCGLRYTQNLKIPSITSRSHTQSHTL